MGLKSPKWLQNLQIVHISEKYEFEQQDQILYIPACIFEWGEFCLGFDQIESIN